MGNDLTIRGTALHVEIFGEMESPAVLYLHGGPGMGAYHFETWQAQRFAGKLRLITLDQRGVLRSAPVPDGQTFGITDLVADCEALRIALGIQRWSLIGHSFGGYLALLYAGAHPSAVDRLVLENPTLDLASSTRSLLAAAALEYGLLGDPVSARTCRSLANQSADAPGLELWAQLATWLGGLGQQRDNLYVYGDNKRLVDELTETAPFPEEWWGRGSTHQHQLISEGRIFLPLLGHLTSIPHPTLLIKGLHDHVFALDQIAAYLQAKPQTRWSVFQASGHFAHMEEPDRFAAEVLAFLAAPS
jgi:proline iminopeptidase